MVTANRRRAERQHATRERGGRRHSHPYKHASPPSSTWGAYFPRELLGAWNALAHTLRDYTKQQGLIPRAASSPDIAATHGRFDRDLDYQPSLSPVTRVLCWTLPLALICVWPLYAAWSGAPTAQPSFARSLLRALLILLRISLSLTFSYVLECALLQREFERNERESHLLGDHDSHTLVIDGLRVHYKSAYAPPPAAPPQRPLAVALHHGFGANLWSWREVQRPLAERLHALVTAHDMPGFGLTERSRDLSKYSPPVNGAIGRRVLDHELTERRLAAPPSTPVASAHGNGDAGNGHRPQSDPPGERDDSETSASAGPSSSGAAQARSSQRGDGSEGGGAVARGGDDGVARVMVGHSLGCAGVLEEVCANPDGVAAVVLVAPAIATSPFLRARLHSASPSERYDGAHVTRERWELADATPEAAAATSAVPSQAGSGALRRFLVLASAVLFRAAVNLAVVLARPLLVIAVRLLVRRKTFWQTGLSNAYFDKSKLSDAMVYYYRLPALASGWDTGIVRFTEAALRSAVSPLWAPRPASRRASLLERFKAVAAERGIPVIIVHGQQDVIVPISNSTRLSASLGGAELVRIANCGHTPAEETPECFVAEVAQFVEREVTRRGGAAAEARAA